MKGGKTLYAQLKNSRIYLFDSFIHKESIKGIPGRLWHSEDKAWSIPIESTNIETLDLLGCELSTELRDLKQKIIQK